MPKEKSSKSRASSWASRSLLVLMSAQMMGYSPYGLASQSATRAKKIEADLLAAKEPDQRRPPPGGGGDDRPERPPRNEPPLPPQPRPAPRPPREQPPAPRPPREQPPAPRPPREQPPAPRPPREQPPAPRPPREQPPAPRPPREQPPAPRPPREQPPAPRPPREQPPAPRPPREEPPAPRPPREQPPAPRPPREEPPAPRPPREQPPAPRPPREEPPAPRPPREQPPVPRPPREQPPVPRPPRRDPPVRPEPPRRPDDDRRGRVPGGGNAERERRDAERERRSREIERERRARDPRDLDRIRREHRDEGRRDRERSIAEREWRRQRDLDRYLRERDQRRRWIEDHRGHWHRDFDRVRRPWPGGRPDWRDHSRWRHRRDRWWDGCHRPLPPPPSRWVDELPLPFPDDGHYWDNDNIYEIAALVESLTYNVYTAALQDLNEPDAWNQETLGLLYDVVEAARIYFDAVRVAPNVTRDTLFELFNLEDAVKAVAPRILCGPLSAYVRDNFGQVKYYIDELLWQYRLDPHYSSITNNTFGVLQDLVTAETAGFALDNDELLTCESFSFPWSKPHREVYWDLSQSDSTAMADTLVVGVLNAQDQKGKNGVGALSRAVVYYMDGTSEDLLLNARRRADPHVRPSGQLLLVDSADRLYLPLDPNRPIMGIDVVADSWISPNVDAVLSFALTRGGIPTVLTIHP